MFDFNLKKMLGDVRDLVAAKNNAVENKRKELHRLNNAALSRSDVINILCGVGGVLDRSADAYDGVLNFTINRLCGNPLNTEKEDGIAVIAAAPPGAAPSIKTVESAILCLLRDEIKASLRKRIEAMPWPSEAGPPIADRPALIKKAEGELVKLEKELADLRSEAAAAGITI